MNANDWPSGRITPPPPPPPDTRSVVVADDLRNERDRQAMEIAMAKVAELQLSVSLAEVVGGMREEIARLKAELEAERETVESMDRQRLQMGETIRRADALAEFWHKLATGEKT